MAQLLVCGVDSESERELIEALHLDHHPVGPSGPSGS
jgi:hypothetical protein